MRAAAVARDIRESARLVLRRGGGRSSAAAGGRGAERLEQPAALEV